MPRRCAPRPSSVWRSSPAIPPSPWPPAAVPAGNHPTKRRSRMADTVIRPARRAERASLEALQWRASLANAGDRDSLLANPDAIALPGDQIADGHVFVAERDGVIVGFAAVLPRTDGDAELDALFVEPGAWRQGVGRLLLDQCVSVARRRA